VQDHGEASDQNLMVVAVGGEKEKEEAAAGL
jgi:hypothetical protein